MNGGLDEGPAHFGRTLELQPVAGAFEDFEPERALNVVLSGFDGSPSKGWVPVAPQEDCGLRDLHLLS
jgi:hypothetical protein